MALKVTVGIPVYNGAKFIGASIESVLNQTFSDFELIVSDDRSTDDTEAIVCSFSDSRIRYVKNERNLGAPGNFNNCINLAKGHYVYLLHADDVMLPRNLERKIKVMDANLNVGMVHSNIYQIDESGKVLDTHWEKRYHEDLILDGYKYFLELISNGNLICAPSVMIRKSCYEKLGGFDCRISHSCDWEMWLRISLFYDVAYIVEPLVLYRFHEEMDTNRYLNNVRGIDQAFKAKHFILQKFPGMIPDLKGIKQTICAHYSRRALALAYDCDDNGNYDELKKCLSFLLRVDPKRVLNISVFKLALKAFLGKSITNKLRKRTIVTSSDGV